MLLNRQVSRVCIKPGVLHQELIFEKSVASYILYFEQQISSFHLSEITSRSKAQLEMVEIL